MKVTQEDINKITYYAGAKRSIELCSSLLEGLLYDLDGLNFLCVKNGGLYISYENTHTYYDPERTEPSPDYYGYFTLRWENEPSEKVGDYMTLEDLDYVLCALCDFVERAFPQCENG